MKTIDKLNKSKKMQREKRKLTKMAKNVTKAKSKI